MRLRLFVFPLSLRPVRHQPTPPELSWPPCPGRAAMSLPGAHPEPWVLSVPLRWGSAWTALSQRGSLGCVWGGYSRSEHLPPPHCCAPRRGVQLPSRSLAFSPPSFWLVPDLGGGFNASCVPPPHNPVWGCTGDQGRATALGMTCPQHAAEVLLHVGGRVLANPPITPLPGPGKGRSWGGGMGKRAGVRAAWASTYRRLRRPRRTPGSSRASAPLERRKPTWGLHVMG